MEKIKQLEPAVSTVCGWREEWWHTECVACSVCRLTEYNR